MFPDAFQHRPLTWSPDDGTGAGGDAGLSGEGVKIPGVADEAKKPAPVETTAADKAKKAAAEDKAKKDDDAPFTMTPAAWKQQIAERQKRAQEELAQSLGYQSVDEMKTVLARAAVKPAAEPAAAAAADKKPKPAAAPAADTAAVPTETPEQKALLGPLRDKLRKEIAAGRQYQKSAREALQQIDALKVESEAQQSEYALRDACRAQGVVGDYVDDVMRRLHVKLNSMTEDEINAFNEDEWIVALKEKHPFYFGEAVRPADTTLAERAQPAKPAPAAATKRAGEAGAFDAMKASKADVDKRISDLGLRPKFQN